MSASSHSKNIKHLLGEQRLIRSGLRKSQTGKKIGNTLVRRANGAQVMKETLPIEVNEA